MLLWINKKKDNAKLLQQLKSGLEEQLTGTNINHIKKHMHKTDIQITYLIQPFKE